VLIAVEEFLTERKETLGRYNIIFKYYALVGLRESPLLRHIARRVATVVLLLIEAMDVTLPVDILVLDQLATLHDALHVIGTRAWTVLIKKETCRTSFPYLSPHLAEVVCPGMKEH
jgi:hypothetical protein